MNQADAIRNVLKLCEGFEFFGGDPASDARLAEKYPEERLQFVFEKDRTLGVASRSELRAMLEEAVSVIRTLGADYANYVGEGESGMAPVREVIADRLHFYEVQGGDFPNAGGYEGGAPDDVE